MKNPKQVEYQTREKILKLLSDDEVAAVSTAETASQLSAGDEFIDLEHFELGVQTGPQKTVPMGRVLPKKAVNDKTWKKIIKQLPTS